MTNHEFILDLLKDGYKHCSNELPFRDERARVGELRRGKNRWHRKFDIGGEPCEGRCGRNHDNPDIHWLWLNNPEQYADILKDITARATKPSHSADFIPQVELIAAQPEKPCLSDSGGSQPKQDYCCEIYKRSIEQHYKPWHSIGCKSDSKQVSQVKLPKPKTMRWQDSPEFNRPILKCCDVAIYCQDKRLPINHTGKCLNNQSK